MLIIDQTLIGRQYYTHDAKTVYTCRGIYIQPESRPVLIGEYPDPTYKVNRITTHKLEDAKFTDFVPVP